MLRYIALLRGINVGGKNKILMADLKRLFLEAGAVNPTTFIQSGNVVFSAPEQRNKVEEAIKALIQDHLGKPIPVVFRSQLEYAEAVALNPYEKEGAPESDLFVMFLEREPELDLVAALDPDRSPGDTYQVIGRQIYLRLTTGAADTKLTNAYFDSKLKTISTSRNWRTTLQLAALLYNPANNPNHPTGNSR